MKINHVIRTLNFAKLSISSISKINFMGNRIEDIYNFLQLSDRIATAGQPTIDQYPTIATAGYQVVINLALKESANALENEDAIATNLGLAYIHIPVIWDRPTNDNFEEFMIAMAAHSERKIFVHCAANMRVSAFMYLYRQIHDGTNEATARQDMVKIWTPNDVWQTFIERILT
jgi:protein tyrosine phosphatase (PTP) superfamily phosphohydrolase (DUF442 family)